VLATNVAETSLTVPGIRYVVDTGTARISRYSQRTKVQRLPIEPVSKASARQRAGRCGRLADGVCIRLYAEEDFEARPDFTDPEILRTNLASVILQMTTLGLGEVAAFPFVDPPDARNVTDGVRLLEELRAFEQGEGDDTRRRLTAYGKTIALLPVDPRLARMAIEADRLGCLHDVLVVVAALSIQDPRERPLEQQEAAALSHKRFADEHSDFVAYLRLWDYLQEQQKALSGSAFRRMCKSEFLHYLRIREWQDLVGQLRAACKSAGFVVGGRNAQDAQDAAGTRDVDAIHRALLSGLLSQVGVRDEAKRDYLGARSARFGISPGSGLFKKQPQVVMAGELVETTRLWAHDVARIDPVWAEELGSHLVKRQYSEPRWSSRQGSAVATERVTLYGVPLVVGRIVGLAKVDPTLARELFIRHALVEGDWTTHHRFFHDNRELLRRLEELEARTRRRDIIVGDDVLLAFYDQRLPAEVVSARHFDTWWKRARRTTPDLLTFTEDLLVRDEAGDIGADAFPTTWHQGDLDLPLTYQFEPGAAADGVTVHIGTEILNRVVADGFDWQVPGLREELVTALIRTLPKTTRRLLVPAPEHAAATVRALRDRGLGPTDGPLAEVLARLLRETHGVVIRPDDWDLARLPDHLRVTYAVHDRPGHVVASGKDLADLREQAAPQVRRQVAAAGRAITRAGMRTWEIEEVPREHDAVVGGVRVHGFPALVDEGDAVALRVLPTLAEADAEHRLGVRRLLLLGTTPPWKHVLGRLTNTQKLALGHNPHGSVPALLEDVLAAAVDAIAAERVHHVPRTRAEFAAAQDAVRTHLGARVVAAVGHVEPILAKHLQIVRRLDAMTAPHLGDLVADVRAQLAELIRPGFVADTGLDRLPDLDRYLRAVLHRLDKAPTDLTRDRQRLTEVLAAEGAYAALLATLRPSQRGAADVTAIAWMIEELRVSLFAQSLGTAYAISVKRIEKAIAAIPRGT
jgi:ATP-dependent helicase HrpA